MHGSGESRLEPVRAGGSRLEPEHEQTLLISPACLSSRCGVFISNFLIHFVV